MTCCEFKFTYFPTRGRGELIRYIFAQANVPHKECVMKFDQWPNEKSKTPFGSLPLLEVNGKQLAQSTTIARYLGAKFGLAGKDEWTKAYCDMLIQCIEDIYGNYDKYFGAVMKGDEGLKAETLNILMEKSLKPLYSKFQKILGDKLYIVGDQLTYADLAVAEMSDRVQNCFDKNFLDSYPNLKQHMIRIHQLPNIKKYVEGRAFSPV